MNSAQKTDGVTAEAEGFVLKDGIHRPTELVTHRDEHYDPATFRLLMNMQEKHFWYRGRHRFLLHAFKRLACVSPGKRRTIVDLGGGCGGWIKYLSYRFPSFRNNERRPLNQAGQDGADTQAPEEVALADSSEHALRMAQEVVPTATILYHVDLRHLPWKNKWSDAFLLDVLEHIPDHREVLSEIRETLRPGGLLFITVPALQQFWSWNDDAVQHIRRYSVLEMRQLGADCGFEVVECRYFMFFLSPLLIASRWLSGKSKDQTDAQLKERLAKSHRIPGTLVNGLLTSVFAMETPLGHWMRFPWGTSLLCVLRRPA